MKIWSPPPGWSLPRKKWLKPTSYSAGRRRVGGDVAADADAGPLRAVHHDRRVPADPGAVAALDLLVAGEPRLVLGRDGVDVVGRWSARGARPAARRRARAAAASGSAPAAGPPAPAWRRTSRATPGSLRGRYRVGTSHAFTDHPNPIGFGCGAGVLGQVLAHELGGQLPLLGRRCRLLQIGEVPISSPHRAPLAPLGYECNEPAIAGTNR